MVDTTKTLIERACRAACRQHNIDDFGYEPSSLQDSIDRGMWRSYEAIVRAVLTEIEITEMRDRTCPFKAIVRSYFAPVLWLWGLIRR